MRRWPNWLGAPPAMRHRLGLPDPNVLIRPWPHDPNDWPDIEIWSGSTSDPNLTAAEPWMTQEQIDRAVRWARSMVGRRYDRTKRYGKGNYYYACLGFVYDAYVKTGTPVGGSYGIAYSSAEALNAPKNRWIVPSPKGAWVFYGCPPYGHVAISMGEGRVIHARTDPAAGQAEIRIDHYLAASPYVGWAWPQQPHRPRSTRSLPQADWSQSRRPIKRDQPKGP
ncbi:MAG: hypothetical protein QHH07_10400 [Sedimentisphaerales bacterium]|nr:hypothetical protein [Sedimentisphaerales bacterium]